MGNGYSADRNKIIQRRYSMIPQRITEESQTKIDLLLIFSGLLFYCF